MKRRINWHGQTWITAVLVCVLAQTTVAAPNFRSAVETANKWTVLDRPNLGFSVKLPGVSKVRDEWTPFGTIHTWMLESDRTLYRVDAAELNCLVTLFTSDENFRKEMLQGLIRGFFAGVEKGAGKKIESKKMIREYTINGFRAEEYVYTIQTKSGRKGFGHSIFSVNQKYCYTFSSAAWLSEPDPSCTFFSSIKLK
ncbi:MAG: hypothetical protein C5B53_02145 [Candidatus Melainabacteria bacterium]|nr:MAG: hypothetical protein C5B53_02145 [Candidatus Melainabacteria bacterium]